MNALSGMLSICSEFTSNDVRMFVMILKWKIRHKQEADDRTRRLFAHFVRREAQYAQLIK